MNHEALLSGCWVPVEILSEWEEEICGERRWWCMVEVDCERFAVARRFVRER